MFIIGLPKQLRAKFEAAVKKAGERVSSVLADIGKEGTLQLLPHPGDAVHKLRAYYDQFSGNYGDAYVVVLPYALIPTDVDNELEALEELGAEIVYVSEGDDGWPVLAKKARPDTRFFNEVFNQLMVVVFGNDEELPSDYFRSISEINPHIIIAKNALETCDQVAEHRRDFFRIAADALIKMVDKNGEVGPIDAFFRDLRLEHAQTGGISTTLTVIRDGKQVHHRTTHTHLKQGDNTTPQAAARIYYQGFHWEQQYYVAILYAGPHPEDNISYVYELSPH